MSLPFRQDQTRNAVSVMGRVIKELVSTYVRINQSHQEGEAVSLLVDCIATFWLGHFFYVVPVPTSMPLVLPCFASRTKKQLMRERFVSKQGYSASSCFGGSLRISHRWRIIAYLLMIISHADGTIYPGLQAVPRFVL